MNVSCCWVTQLTYYSCPFRPIWPILAWADQPVFTSLFRIREERKNYSISKLGYASLFAESGTQWQLLETVDLRLSTAHCHLQTVNWTLQLPTVKGTLSPEDCLLHTVNCTLLTEDCQWHIVNYRLSMAHCQLQTVNWQNWHRLLEQLIHRNIETLIF